VCLSEERQQDKDNQRNVTCTSKERYHHGTSLIREWYMHAQATIQRRMYLPIDGNVAPGTVLYEH
jgi:hypothetical protein